MTIQLAVWEGVPHLAVMKHEINTYYVKPLIIQYLPVSELQLRDYNVGSTVSLALCICLCEKSIQPVIQMLFICTSISSFKLKTP